MRNEILYRLDKLRYNAEETHKMQWESKKRTDELNELNSHLNDINKDLHDERDNFNRLQDENQQLSEIKYNNEQKLNHMNHMVEPIEHEVVFKENQKPETMQKYISKHEGKVNTFDNNKEGKRYYKNTPWHKTMDRNVTSTSNKTINKNTNKNTKTLGVNNNSNNTLNAN